MGCKLEISLAKPAATHTYILGDLVEGIVGLKITGQAKIRNVVAHFSGTVKTEIVTCGAESRSHHTEEITLFSQRQTLI